jgi:hypothetical protein
MSISYTVTVYNELKELKILLPILKQVRDRNDEIIIVHTFREESEKHTDLDVDIRQYSQSVADTYQRYHFDKKFAEMKNFTNGLAIKDWIINFDADEYASVETIAIWKGQLVEDVDLLYVPRVNTVEGYTEEDVKKFGWKINDNGWINWPDYQPRIFKNNGNIRWEGNVHEQITGYKEMGGFPQNPACALIHRKEITKQRSQNELYESIKR